MTTRELPQSEWHRLRGTNLEPLVATRPNDVIAIVVVEDRDGVIVGQWALASFVHAEGVEIRKDHRKAAAVPKLLLAGMRRAITDRGLESVLTGAETSDVGELLEKIGAVPVMTTYFWPMKSQAERVGAAFHQTFEQSAGHPPDHPPIPEHDRAVGAAILKAFAGDIVAAEDDYNTWARNSGFMEASFSSMTDDGRMVVDSGPYQFTIAPSGVCEVRETCQSGER